MPIARNLSLPSSIESRKKKRPETLFHRSITEVQGTSHCTLQRSKPVNLFLPKVNRPNCFLPTSPRKDEAPLVEYTSTEIPNSEHGAISNEAKSDTNEGNIEVAEKTNTNEIVMGVDTTTTRGGTLSQPCLSVRNVGATQIFPHLFLGSQKDVVDETMMRTNGITYVLNVSKTCTKPEFIGDSHFHRISVHDSYQEKMTPHINEAIEFIEKVRKSNQRVIVHCLAGVSRSATVAIAYVLYYLRINFEQAYSFVKEKRPSISPNFNFLGQLMEFEKSLTQSGYLTNKRTGSLSDESDGEEYPKFSCQTADEPSTTMRTGTITMRRASLKLNFFDKKATDSNPLVMPVTCSFKCTTRGTAPHQASGTTLRISPTSSLSKRRNGPTFIKGAFSNNAESKFTLSANECGSALPKFDNQLPFSAPRVVLDVKVETPATSRVGPESRRLGSDGFEKYESMACDTEDTSFSNAFSPLRKQISVVATEDLSMDCTDSISVSDDALKKSRTAPNTPIIGRSKSEKNPPWRLGQLAPTKPMSRHRRSASGGGISAELLQSSSMKRRFELESSSCNEPAEVKERSHSSPVAVEHSQIKRGSALSGSYYNHSEPSSRAPHKFVSVNARSPKVLRKSLQLNVRPVYQGKAVVKSEDAAAPVSTPSVLQMDGQPLVFDCRHTMPEHGQGLELAVPSVKMDAADPGTDAEDSLVINSMSPLTLSSPNVDADGAPRFPNGDSQSVTSPATCPVMSNPCDPFTRIDAPRFLCKGSFSYSPNKGRGRNDGKTSQTTILSSPEGLKLKWRNNSNRRRQSVDSGYLSSQNSSQASSSFTSPTSQQTIFGVGSLVHDSFPEIPMDNEAHTPSPTTCHAEGAMFTTEDVSGSGSDSDSHKSNVRQRNAMELVSCS